jgi:Mce-associated membrane protein
LGKAGGCHDSVMARDGSPNGKQAPLVSATDSDEAVDAADALALAEQAEAEAAEAEALADAAHARARAIRLRRKAQAAEAATAQEGSEAVEADSVDEGVGDGEADESRPDAPPKRTGRRPSWLRVPKLKTVAAGVAVVIICASLGVSGYMFWVDRDQAQIRERAAEYESAARQGVVNLMSLDFNHAKDDVQRAIDSTTGDFKRDFQSTADDWVKMMTDSKVSTTVTVTATAVDARSVTDTSANVLVAARTDVTNSAGAKEDPRSWRLAVTVVREGDQIKMSKVDFVA